MKQIIKLKSLLKYSFYFVLILLVSFSCRKNKAIDTDVSARLEFSNDTITFDTLFTTMGSVTKQFRVYNPNSNPVSISRIALALGDKSPYQINVDGQSGTAFYNQELAGGDSLFVFVRITIDPNNQNNPLLVRDSVLFDLNGNQQDVDLYAWGQDAHFIMPNLSIEGLPPLNIIAHEGETLHWTNDKPYVVVGYAVVDSTAHLIVDAGAQIHFYKNSGLWIYKGANIQVNGSLEEPVVFQGTRTDADYNQIPAQWDRIWINESAVNSRFDYAVIQNATIGIQAETLNESMGNTLVLNNTKILNMSGWGIFTRFYHIQANNLLVANAGSSLLNLTTGGNYEFKNCTFGNYWGFGVRKDPLLHLSNYYILPTADGDLLYTGDMLNAYFGNCIFYGALDEEILIDPLEESETDFPYTFEHCIIKTNDTTNSHFQNSLFNQDPLFKSPYEENFHLDTLSPAIDAGLKMGFPLDLDGVLRDEKPDIGAFEFQPLPPEKRIK